MNDALPLDAFDGEALDIIVPHALDGVRVDRALSMLTGLSRGEMSSVIDAGAVRVDDHVVKKSSVSLAEGQHLVAVFPPLDDGSVTPDPSVSVSVVLEDEHFAIVNKDAGVVVHPGAGQREGTLVAGLIARYPSMLELVEAGVSDPVRPGVVHRLDKGTSGLLVFAKTPEAYYSLGEQLSERTMERTYLGLVEGHVTEERGVVDAPIGRSTRQPTLMVVRGDGRPARTGYRVLSRIDKPHAVTLLELKLETGRTHQIRVHLGTIGHPVVNDTRYGHRRDRRLVEERFFLHSTTLSFQHPITGDTVAAHAPLPEDLAALVPGFESL